MRYEPRALKLGGLGILFNLTKSVDFDDSEGKREEFCSGLGWRSINKGIFVPGVICWC